MTIIYSTISELTFWNPKSHKDPTTLGIISSTLSPFSRLFVAEHFCAKDLVATVSSWSYLGVFGVQVWHFSPQCLGAKKLMTSLQVNIPSCLELESQKLLTCEISWCSYLWTWWEATLEYSESLRKSMCSNIEWNMSQKIGKKNKCAAIKNPPCL